MNISIIGPDGSGKTTLANQIAKKLSFGRQIFFIGRKRSEFPSIPLDKLHEGRNVIHIIDDANAYLDSIDIYNKTLNLKAPFVLHREDNVINIGVFHSFDDAVKYFFRQSRYIYVSNMYRDESFKKNKFIKGIEPVEVGRKQYVFQRFKRY